jgi:hypothetical protein
MMKSWNGNRCVLHANWNGFGRSPELGKQGVERGHCLAEEDGGRPPGLSIRSTGLAAGAGAAALRAAWLKRRLAVEPSSSSPPSERAEAGRRLTMPN